MRSLVTAQAMAVYKTLNTAKTPLTVSDIANQLHLLAPAIYRSVEQLVQFGVIEPQLGYPLTFRVIPSEQAVNWYLLEARKHFLKTFPPAMHTPTKEPSTAISFIKNRSALLQQTDLDTEHAAVSIDFMVSGLIVPDKTVLTYRAAMGRGVKIRALLQKRTETPRSELERWKDFGIEARYTDDVSMRLFIFDQKIVYMTSYNQTEKNHAFGIRFHYPPIAKAMSELFEEKWRSATLTS